MKLTKTLFSSLALTTLMGTAGFAQAAENPFALQDLQAGFMLAAAEDNPMAGVAKDSKCGGAKETESKAPAGKCGGATGKTSEGKCGGKATESKTMEAKCGGSK